MLPQWSLPSGFCWTSENISGARPLTNQDTNWKQTTQGHAIRPSALSWSLLIAALVGFSSFLDITPFSLE